MPEQKKAIEFFVVHFEKGAYEVVCGGCLREGDKHGEPMTDSHIVGLCGIVATCDRCKVEG